MQFNKYTPRNVRLTLSLCKKFPFLIFQSCSSLLSSPLPHYKSTTFMFYLLLFFFFISFSNFFFLFELLEVRYNKNSQLLSPTHRCTPFLLSLIAAQPSSIACGLHSSSLLLISSSKSPSTQHI
jgi:hypothetical protein